MKIQRNVKVALDFLFIRELRILPEYTLNRIDAVLFLLCADDRGGLATWPGIVNWEKPNKNR